MGEKLLKLVTTGGFTMITGLKVNSYPTVTRRVGGRAGAALRRVLIAATAAIFVGIVFSGCGWFSKPASEEAETGPPPPPLRVVVLGGTDPADRLERLRSEWQSQARFGFEIESPDSPELLSLQKAGSGVDVIITSYQLLPAVVEAVELEPIPRSILEDPAGRWTNVFGTLRVRMLRWAERPVIVPLGSAVFVLYIRADLLEQLKAKPPTTWDEYQKLAERLARIGPPAAAPQQTAQEASRTSRPDEEDADDSARGMGASLTGQGLGASPEGQGAEEESGSRLGGRWFGTLEPLAPGWAGRVLLARAAAYIAHRDHFSTLFSIDDMTPLIDREPFVRALEQLCEAAKLGSSDVLTLTPDAVRQAFWRGQCGMAITWPSPTAVVNAIDPPPAVTFAELPGSPDVYDVRRAQWQKRRKDEPWQVPLLGVDGWVGVVPRTSARKSDAFQLLFWLSVEQASEFGANLPGTTLYRSEHLTGAKRWVEAPVSEAGAIEYALLVRQMLEKPVAILALPLPGSEEYLKALDEAVAQAVSGQMSPREALKAAAEKWQAITEKWGRDRQLRAYKHSMNLP